MRSVGETQRLTSVKRMCARDAVHSARLDSSAGPRHRSSALVSVLARNLTQTAETEEKVESGEIEEIANTDTVSVHVAESMLGCSKRMGGYPIGSTLFSD